MSVQSKASALHANKNSTAMHIHPLRKSETLISRLRGNKNLQIVSTILWKSLLIAASPFCLPKSAAGTTQYPRANDIAENCRQHDDDPNRCGNDRPVRFVPSPGKERHQVETIQCPPC